MKRAFIAAFALFASTINPAQATPQLRNLLTAVQSTGTTLAVDDPQQCRDPKLMGRYSYQRNVVDQLLICVANHKGDNAELYDTILHESVHVAQACKGGPLFNPESIYRFALATEVDLVKKAYSNSQSLIELEARVIAREQDEVFVTNLIKEHCK
jgi:hypothetical protein